MTFFFRKQEVDVAGLDRFVAVEPRPRGGCGIGPQVVIGRGFGIHGIQVHMMKVHRRDGLRLRCWRWRLRENSAVLQGKSRQQDRGNRENPRNQFFHRSTEHIKFFRRLPSNKADPHPPTYLRDGRV